jgi:pimeloyl-ACP methyl ester carboxylesterase
MYRYEITFPSANSANNPKHLVALVAEPDRIGPATGVLLCSHGWGGNRYGDVGKMDIAADAHDVVCIGVEFRQSGYASNPVTGTGWDCPYDLSFYQLFDVLNALRQILHLRPALNRRRLYHYGGSQGGHLALLSAIVAPDTFASVYSSCGAVFVDSHFVEWAGREFQPHELSVRSVIEHVAGIRCPVFLDHGTADAEVPCDPHTRALEQRLRALGSPVEATYYEGAGHMLGPVTSRVEAFRAVAPRFLACENARVDDFSAGSRVALRCADPGHSDGVNGHVSASHTARQRSGMSP